MYSRNTWEKKGFTVPPGYDGSRFRRNSRRGGDVILIPDSGFADHEKYDETLSVGGIPTAKGIDRRRALSASAENDASAEDAIADYDAVAFTEAEAEDNTADTDCDDTDTDDSPKSPGGKLSSVLDKLGFDGKLSSDELILCALIFIIASDRDNDGRNVGDILLILALLLGLR